MCSKCKYIYIHSSSQDPKPPALQEVDKLKLYKDLALRSLPDESVLKASHRISQLLTDHQSNSSESSLPNEATMSQEAASHRRPADDMNDLRTVSFQPTPSSNGTTEMAANDGVANGNSSPFPLLAELGIDTNQDADKCDQLLQELLLHWWERKGVQERVELTSGTVPPFALE